VFAAPRVRRRSSHWAAGVENANVDRFVHEALTLACWVALLKSDYGRLGGDSAPFASGSRLGCRSHAALNAWPMMRPVRSTGVPNRGARRLDRATCNHRCKYEEGAREERAVDFELAYMRRRAAEERRNANAVPSKSDRKRHLLLAKAFEECAQKLELSSAD
jgi:hypothetical protein